MKTNHVSPLCSTLLRTLLTSRRHLRTTIKRRFATVSSRAVAIAALFVSIPGVNATVYTWDGGGADRFFSTAGNWSGDIAPPLADLANTELQFGGTVRTDPRASQSYSAHSLTFNSGAGAFTISGATLTIGAGGIRNNSTLAQRIDNRVVVAADQSWSFGSGAGTLNLTGLVEVEKRLSITGGRVNFEGVNFIVDDPTSSGSAILDLSAGTFTSDGMTVGSGGTGAVNHSGGTLSVGGVLFFGRGSASSGTYNLSGTGQFSASQLRVGYFGSGTVNQSGGSVTAGTVFLGYTGENSDGTYNQTGGTANLTNLLVGHADGTDAAYNLSGGTLTTGTAQVSANGNTATFVQSGGTHIVMEGLVLGSSDALANGTYHLNGGTLATTHVTHLDGNGTFNFNGGTLQITSDSTGVFASGAADPSKFTVNVRDGGAVIDTQTFSYTEGQTFAHSSIGGDNAIDGGLTKTGSGTLTLSGGNTYTGGTTVSGGVLRVSSDANLGAPSGAVTLQNSGQLVFTESTITARTFNLNNGTADFGGSYLEGATVNGGFVAGGVSLGAARFAGVTTLRGSTLSVFAGGSTLDSTTIRGSLSVTDTSATLQLTNGFITGSGSLTVGSGLAEAPAVVNTTNTEIQGVTTINSAGTIANSGASLYLSGGSRTTINSGGTLAAASGSTVELNGSLLTNNGTQTGMLNVNYGSTAKGAGTFGTVNVGEGGKFSPGNSPGTATVDGLSLGSGGSYVFELNSATATAGIGADFINNLGNLDIAAGTTANSVFTIAIVSLDSANQSAALSDFDATQPYSFTLMTSAGGITGFDAREFAIDASGFRNDLRGGSFSVGQQGNDLILSFAPAPVPEPSTWATLGLGALFLLGANRWRRPGR